MLHQDNSGVQKPDGRSRLGDADEISLRIEQPDLVALSTATAGGLDGVAEVLRALKALQPRPYVVAGGQFWTGSTRGTALDLGADHVEQDPRALVAELHIRVPPPG